MINLENKQEIAEHIAQNINSHKQMALATVSSENKPWVVCVNFTYDERFNLLWKSLKTTVHSKNIIENPNVAICIFSENKGKGDFGLYIKARAKEVNNEDQLQRLLQIRYKDKPMPPLSDFIGVAGARIYYAEIEEAHFNDDRHIKTIVDLENLRNVIRKTGATYE